MSKLLVCVAGILAALQVFHVNSENASAVCTVPPVHCGNRHKHVSINYTVISPNRPVLKTSLTLEEGCSFFYAMMLTANEDKRFQFSGDYWGGKLTGFFITKINNVTQIPDKHLYWMFYVNSTSEASSCGISSTAIKANTNYILKLEQFPPSHH